MPSQRYPVTPPSECLEPQRWNDDDETATGRVYTAFAFSPSSLDHWGLKRHRDAKIKSSIGGCLAPPLSVNPFAPLDREHPNSDPIRPNQAVAARDNMHFSLLFITPLVLLSQLALAKDLEEICNGLPGIDDCTGTIKVPIDPCKTKTTFKYPCPTWKEPTKLCDGTTCVPGTVTKTVNVPCGISIVTKDVSLCQSVRDSLGNSGSEFINKAGAMCNCIPKLLNFIKAAFWQVVLGGSLDVDTSVVTEMVRLQNCVLSEGLDIQDNRDEVYAEKLTSKDGWIVFHAAEITLATYAEMVLAVSPCLTGVACKPTAVASFFKRYVKDSAVSLALQVAKMLSGWNDTFGKLKITVTAVSDSATSFATNLAPVPGKVQTVKGKICQSKRCAGPGVSAFMKKVSTAITTAQSLQSIQEAAGVAAKAAPEMISVVDKTIAVTKNVPTSKYLMGLITSGALTKIEDVLQSFQIVEDLPNSVAELEDIISPIETLVSNYESLGKNALAAVKGVVSFSWDAYAKELKVDPSGKLREGLLEIQKTFKAKLLPLLSDLNADIKDLKDVLATSPVKKGEFQFKAGVADYQRWMSVSMDAPCAKQVKSNFELGGYKTSYAYPSFYSCEYGPQNIQWPNHFVPYIKFTLA
ncbi:hypothetical protein AK830_g4474 [Neonectria ditissima]|uniref:Uncharacterized protein n=1 Tax=Neonectria ditissima TaxID=78410 RepID=A0A0P7BN02_9HYPO|nr:hypothetical protein AK830_g4474 [Neonectria ditissima]